jgi:hypothetical protein
MQEGVDDIEGEGAAEAQEIEEVAEKSTGDSPLSEESEEDIWAEPETAPETETEVEAETEEEVSESAQPLSSGVKPEGREAAADGSPEAGDLPGGATAPSGSDSAQGPVELLGDKSRRLFEYLKGLSSGLPPDKREEFEASGVRDKLEGLIDKLAHPENLVKAFSPARGLRERAEEARSRPYVPPPPRPVDPRRERPTRRMAERRAESDRRDGESDRRMIIDRRSSEDRRSQLDRREPEPIIDLPPAIPSDAVLLTLSEEGKPIEIAGIRVSAKLARLLEILKAEKYHG